MSGTILELEGKSRRTKLPILMDLKSYKILYINKVLRKNDTEQVRVLEGQGLGSDFK